MIDDGKLWKHGAVDKLSTEELQKLAMYDKVSYKLEDTNDLWDEVAEHQKTIMSYIDSLDMDIFNEGALNLGAELICINQDLIDSLKRKHEYTLKMAQARLEDLKLIFRAKGGRLFKGRERSYFLWRDKDVENAYKGLREENE